jgi:acyl carrier protein
MSGNQDQVRQRIVCVLSEVFDLPADVVEKGVSPDKIVGWDSEKHVVLVIALEDRFGCMFEAEEVPELVSLEKMEEIVKRHGATGD